MTKQLLLFAFLITIISCSSDDDNKSNLNIPENGLLAYYPFDNNANDASINTNNGIVNEAILVTGRNDDNNSAYDFSESESNIDIGDVNFFHGVNNSFSISAWIKIGQFNNSSISIVSKLSQNNSIVTCNEFEEEVVFSITPLGKLAFNYYEESNEQLDRKAVIVQVTDDQSSINLNEWTHVAVTYNGNGDTPLVGITNQTDPRTRLYINGILKTASVTGTVGDLSEGIEITDRSAHLAIGNFLKSDGTVCDDRSFDGAIDDVAIYDRILSSSEITSLFEAN